MDPIRRMIAQLAGRFSPTGKRQSLYEQNVPTYEAAEEDPLYQEMSAINKQYPLNRQSRYWEDTNPQAGRDRAAAINQLRYGITPQPDVEQGSVPTQTPLASSYNPAGERQFQDPVAGLYHPDMAFSYYDQNKRRAAGNINQALYNPNYHGYDRLREDPDAFGQSQYFTPFMQKAGMIPSGDMLRQAMSNNRFNP